MFNETTVDTSQRTEETIIITCIIFLFGLLMFASVSTCDHKEDEEQQDDVVVFSLSL
jgi:hypothetical protein